MTDGPDMPMDRGCAGRGGSRSIWDRQPDLVWWDIVTWEQAACVRGSLGKSSCVAASQRLLPHDVTEPIYDLLRQAERLLLRRTEPLPPYRERLARDFVPAPDGAEGSPNTFTLDSELARLLELTRPLGEIVPDWDARVETALGAQVSEVATTNRDFAPLGVPRGQFSMHYGYRINLHRVRGSAFGPVAATHGSLLMGCCGPDSSQPGLLRDLCDELRR